MIGKEGLKKLVQLLSISLSLGALNYVCATDNAVAQIYGTGQTNSSSNNSTDIDSTLSNDANQTSSDGDSNSLQNFSGGYQASTNNMSGFKADPLASHLVVAPKNVSSSDPITYLADHETYDNNGIVVWSGNVRVWQGDQALRADKITLDRPAGLITATGHVALVQPDGTVLYASQIELAHGFKDGIGHNIYIHMQENAKLAGTGMRRTDSDVTDLAHVVYTPCEVCEKSHTAPPFWDIAARKATRDTEHANIQFDRAWLRVMGVPIMYFPYLSLTDPTAKRRSGWLMPSISPHNRYLGSTITLPYYFVLNKNSDLLVRGLISSKSGPQISGVYRNYQNFGRIKILGYLADDTIKRSLTDNSKGAQGYLNASADFNINRHWHLGGQLRLATNADYMRDYRIPGYGGDTQESTGYTEGFGQGSYTRLDVQYYQSLNRGVINNSIIPEALPRFTYDFQGQPDRLGGRFSVHTTDYYLRRSNGVSDERGEFEAQYDRPFTNRWGQKWLITGRLDGMIYHYTGFGSDLSQGVNSMGNERELTGGSHTHGQILPTGAVKMNWPFLRTFDHGRGSHIFEPIAQFIIAPGSGNYSHTPIEDAYAYDFDDTTLFSINRFQGTDRLDGGIRGNFGIHQNWSWRGHVVDMLIGESVQAKIKRSLNIPIYDGLNDHHLSDPVGRITFSPNRFIDVTARGRFNPWRKKFDYAEGLVNLGVPAFKINGGYIYEPTNPYYYYDNTHNQNCYSSSIYGEPLSSQGTCYQTPTNEVSAGFTAKWRQYHISGFMRRNLQTSHFVTTGGEVGYSNDCFGLNLIWMKQYTYIGGQRRNNTFLLNFYLKTIGSFGVSENGG